MSEGIPELGAKEEDDASDEEDKEEEEQPDVEQIEIKSNKPKTRFFFVMEILGYALLLWKSWARGRIRLKGRRTKTSPKLSPPSLEIK